MCPGSMQAPMNDFILSKVSSFNCVHADSVQNSLQCATANSHTDYYLLTITHSLFHSRLTIRYDTRCYFNVRSKADISRLNLAHGNDN